MSDEVNPVENLLEVTDGIFVEVSEFREEKRIDVRRWYQNKDGGFYRTRKGLNVTLDEWNDLVAKIEEVDKYVQEKVKDLK